MKLWAVKKYEPVICLGKQGNHRDKGISGINPETIIPHSTRFLRGGACSVEPFNQEASGVQKGGLKASVQDGCYKL